MRVHIALNAAPSSGGMYRVLTGLQDNLPKHGVEVVDSPHTADVVHAHIQLYANYAPSVPLVVSSHGMLWGSVWGEQWATNRVLIEAYLQADIVTAPSHFVANTIARNTLIPARVITHGIDAKLWQPSHQPENYVLWNKARVDSSCNPSAMQELAKLSTGFNFKTTFGTPTENVEVIGLLPPDQMHQAVCNAGVYLSTALESGGPSFGVLEALACGVPVLAWRDGGTAESITHLETGYLAEPYDMDDLVYGLAYCQQHRARLATAARQAVLDRYTWDKVIPEYLAAYEAAIHEHTHPVEVSVIVPCHNLGKFLPACLDSVIKQTSSDWEVVVIDDASTDNSWEIAQQYAAQHPNIRAYKNDVNLHVSDTRNRAARLARGAYILPLDADDRLAPDAVALLAGVLNKDRSTQIAAGRLLVCDEGNLTQGYYGGWPNNSDYNLQVTGYNRLPYASMYRRKVWQNIGGYRRRIRTGIEDADFWTRALSYGYRAQIIDDFTLYYTQRSNSLRNANPYGAIAWMQWFPWTRNIELSPFGATGEGPYVVEFTTPKISVVIPVGPHHAHHIQGCVDSLTAQSFYEWEAIVVNDTGERWFDDEGKPLTQYVMGMPFVKFIDGDQNRGVAAARNRGIQAATTDRVVFLDVDDTAQPLMLEVLYKASQLTHDTWIYGDWFTNTGEAVTLSEAPDWNCEKIIQQAIAPLTGLYERTHLTAVGGFDENAPGWEDWDLHLRLLELGIGGVRVNYPLITYNMHLGERRERDFANMQDLLHYIVMQHPKLYKDEGTRIAVCKKCGGGKTTLRVDVAGRSAAAQPIATEEKVEIRYTGPEKQFRIIKSKTRPGATYNVSNLEPFYVYASDLDWILSIQNFERVPKPAAMPPAPSVAVPDNPSDLPLVSDAPQKIAERGELASPTWDSLEPVLGPEITHKLQKAYPEPSQVRSASDASLLAIRGIGLSRLEIIRKVLPNV